MVRQAKIEDLAAVAKIHMACFPGTVTSSLGKLWNGKIVKEYYKEYYKNCPELFLVAENDSGSVFGYAMGFELGCGNIDKRFVKHHLFVFLIGFLYLLFKGDKECWRKLGSIYGSNGNDNSVKILDHDIDRILDSEKARFYTMGVFEEYRGKSHGRALTESYFEACRKAGKKICLIYYVRENYRAESLYYKLGCKPYLEIGINDKVCYKEL